jgi:hypothetical protein
MLFITPWHFESPPKYPMKKLHNIENPLILPLLLFLAKYVREEL